MRIAIEFDKTFSNDQVIYNLLIQYMNEAPIFILPSTKKCENTKTFESMAKQFQLNVEYHKFPENASDISIFITNKEYEIISD